MKNLIIYVHGKGGSSGEAKKEFFAFFTTQRSRFEHIILVANSIGAFFFVLTQKLRTFAPGLNDCT